jgi:hypothetical protein
LVQRRVAAFPLRLLEEARLVACRSIENLGRALRTGSESRDGMNGAADSSLSFGQPQMDRLPTTTEYTSSIDCISVGVDRMPRNFEPMRKLGRSELTDVTA